MDFNMRLNPVRDQMLYLENLVDVCRGLLWPVEP